MSGQPLAGLKVLDLAWVVAGPMVGRSLADFGATVIRVESTTRIDTARILGPYPNGEIDPQASLGYENCNAGKLGVTLDLAREEARETVRDLAAWADVVVESFLPGQMERFGLDYARLSQGHPDLIMVSSSLTGQVGPTAKLAGFGNIGAALSGVQHMVGLKDDLPLGPFGPYTDYVAPRFALIALLAALDRRRRTGEGCHIDISQVETVVTLLAPQLLDYQVTGRIAAADGNRDAHYAPHGVFRAQGEDKWVAIAVRSDAEWHSLATLIGGEALAGETRFQDLAGRKQHEDDLEALVEAWTARHSSAEIEDLLQAQGIPAHRVADTNDICADPQLAHRGSIVRMPHPRFGETVFDASRFSLSETPAQYLRPAPTYGRDNDHVLGEVLGYPAERIEQLRQAGALN